MTWEITAREFRTLPTINPIGCHPYQGRAPIDEAEPGNPNKDEPSEAEADGCPGGWYRGPYISSIIPYLRTRTDGGGRVANPRFDGAPWQVQEAVMHVERESERWQGHIGQAGARISERVRAKASKGKG